jgi:hypothetical protein
MNESENIHRLESDLEEKKRDLREDFQQIGLKARETKAELSPARLMRQRILLLSGIALLLGFALGYRGVPLEEVGKPAARTLLNQAGKQAGARAIWGLA